MSGEPFENVERTGLVCSTRSTDFSALLVRRASQAVVGSWQIVLAGGPAELMS
jgi:hypothetical protein